MKPGPHVEAAPAPRRHLTGFNTKNFSNPGQARAPDILHIPDKSL